LEALLGLPSLEPYTWPRKQGICITADAPAPWATLESWLRTNDQPWLLFLDNAEEFMISYGPDGAKVGLPSNRVARPRVHSCSSCSFVQMLHVHM
jgi:hypothetical protein